MKKYYLLFLTFFPFIFISCIFTEVKIMYPDCNVSKDYCTSGEEIDVFLTGHLKNEAYVRYVYIGISVFKVDNNENTESIPFDLLKVNDKTINTDNIYYQEYKDSYNSELFRYRLESEENIININEKITISIPQTGSYVIRVIYEAVSEKNPFGDTTFAERKITVE